MKASIVGIGHVGASVGLILVVQDLVDDLVLVSRRREAAAAEALDLMHAGAFTSRPTDVRAGDVADTAGSDVVILCAASQPQPTDAEGAPHPRTAATSANAALFIDLIPPLAAASPGAVFVIATNPLDVMTTLTLRLSGLPAARVMGTGTLLDTMRLRVLLAEHCDIHPMDIRAYVLGEHGDTQFAALSSASSGGAKLPVKPGLMRRLAADTRRAGYDIFKGKGHTNHGVAMSVAAIVRAVGRDTREVMPVCTHVADLYGVRGVCLSVPAVVGRGGVQRVLKVELTPAERAAFRRSARAIQQTLIDIGH